jgi:isochorismate synthase
VAGVLEDWPGSNAASSDADGGEALVTSASGSQRTPGQPLTLPPEQRDEVRSMVVAVLEAIASGAVRKVVIATSATTKRSPSPDPARVAATLRKRRVGSFVYLLQLGESPAFVGASPERLVRVQGDIVETVALAGSAPRAADAAADREMGSALLASRKDRAEQSIVVETIRESLEPVTGELDVPPGPRLRKLQQIQHLESRIRGRLSGPQRLLDVAALLHPTPALGGMPRGEAMALIERLEGGTRGLYGGAIGWVDGAGDGDLTVGIRCLLLAGDEVTAYAGAGVVEGSDPDAELREMELKLASVLAVLDDTESSALGQDTSAQASAGPGAAPPERDTLG